MQPVNNLFLFHGQHRFVLQLFILCLVFNVGTTFSLTVEGAEDFHTLNMCVFRALVTWIVRSCNIFIIQVHSGKWQVTIWAPTLCGYQLNCGQTKFGKVVDVLAGGRYIISFGFHRADVLCFDYSTNESITVDTRGHSNLALLFFLFVILPLILFPLHCICEQTVCGKTSDAWLSGTVVFCELWQVEILFIHRGVLLQTGLCCAAGLIWKLLFMNGKRSLPRDTVCFLAGGWREHCRMSQQAPNDRKMCHPPCTAKYHAGGPRRATHHISKHCRGGEGGVESRGGRWKLKRIGNRLIAWAPTRPLPFEKLEANQWIGGHPTARDVESNHKKSRSCFPQGDV